MRRRRTPDGSDSLRAPRGRSRTEMPMQLPAPLPEESAGLAPAWATAISVPEMVARVQELPVPAHNEPEYLFPPMRTADVYGRGDAGSRITSGTALSSVLLVLLEHRGLPHVLLTKRTGKISHGGEVAFPGGKNETEEADVDAALREAKEEIGLAQGRVRVVGEMERLVSQHGLVVTPVVALGPTLAGAPGADEVAFLPSLTPSPDEVESIFHVPLWPFLVESDCHTWQSMPPQGQALMYLHHHHQTFDGESYDVWGQTFSIIMRLAELIYDRPPEYDIKPPAQQHETDQAKL